MRSWTLAAVALVGLGCAVGCSRSKEQAPAPASSAVAAPSATGSGSAMGSGSAGGTSLRFDWTPPLRASVKQLSDIGGRKTGFEYDVVVAKAGNPDRIGVSFENVRFHGAETSSTLRLLSLAIADGEVFPPLEIARGGDLLELPGADQVMHDAVSTLAQKPDALPAEEARATKLLEASETREAIVAKVTERWALWVEAWTPLPVPFTAPVELPLEVPLLDGTKATTTVKFAAPVPVPGSPGLVRLSASWTVDGDRAREAAAHAARQALGEPDPPLEPGDGIQSVRRETRLDLDTNPATMRPRRALGTVTSTLVTTKGKTVSRRDVDEFLFDWQRAP
jgi:hypothetical protein